VEAAFYYLAIAAVILIGIIGGRWARSTLLAALIGLMGNLFMVTVLFGTTIVLTVLAPGSLSSDNMGFRLGALLLFGSAVGVVAAIGSRRRAARLEARPF
jgi:hypothetical protein